MKITGGPCMFAIFGVMYQHLLFIVSGPVLNDYGPGFLILYVAFIRIQGLYRTEFNILEVTQLHIVGVEGVAKCDSSYITEYSKSERCMKYENLCFGQTFRLIQYFVCKAMIYVGIL